MELVRQPWHLNISIEKKSDYSRSSFLFDVRENAADLNSLQRKLIMDLKHIDVKIESAEEGVEILKENLSNCEAFIILDNVDHSDQLESFLPSLTLRVWF